jgi:hypothetical protein
MQNLKGKYDMGGVASSSRTCILCTELELKKTKYNRWNNFMACTMQLLGSSSRLLSVR